MSVVVLLLGLVACGSTGDATVERTSFKGEWPLTTDSAIVTCGSKNKQSVGVIVNGTTYALNGTARTSENWPALDPVWAPNLATGARVSVGDLIEYAHQHCASK